MLGAILGLATYDVPVAAAEARGLGLNWVRLQGAEHCISALELMNRIESANRVLFVRANEAVLTIEGYVRPSREPKGWIVALAVSRPDGEVLGLRELGPIPGDDCSVIEQPVDLVLHLTLDPDEDLGGGIPLPPEIQSALGGLFPHDEVDPDPDSLPKPDVRHAKELHSTPHLATGDPPDPTPLTPTASALFDVSGTSGLGQLPGFSPGVMLHAALVTKIGWQVELGFASMPSQLARATAAPGRATFELQMGSLAICPWQVSSLLSLCGGAEYGRMSAVPTGFASNDAASSRSIFDVLGLGVLRIGIVGPLYMRGALTLVLPLLRNDYVYETASGEPRLFRMSPVAGRAELGLGFHL